MYRTTRHPRLFFVGLMWAVASAAYAQSAITLAVAAQHYADSALGLEAGTAKAVMIDSKALLGDCAAGWQWNFALGSRTTLEVYCPQGNQPRRFVSLRLPLPTAAGAHQSDVKGAVLLRDLPFGHVLTVDDMEIRSLPQGARPGGQTLSSLTELVGKALTRPMRAQETLGRADVIAMITVKRSSQVAGWSVFSGGKVGSRLIALQDGRPGQWIELENPVSKRRVHGEVQADGTVLLGSERFGATNIPAAPKVLIGAVD